MPKFLLIAGDPVAGYDYTGPFETEDEAIEWAGEIYNNPYWWVVELDEPQWTEPNNDVIEGTAVEVIDPLEEPKEIPAPTAA